MKKGILFGLAMSVMMMFNASVFAAGDHKIVIQLSDADIGKQNLALNVAGNLQKHYGLADSQIEVVAFGPGLKLLVHSPKDKKEMMVENRVNGLAANNIRFSACGNTLKKMTKKMGHKPTLNKNSVVVEAGAARIADLVSQGYVLIRP
jgi:intracellular sulfur oxidation DsrE/DsrF family protein